MEWAHSQSHLTRMVNHKGHKIWVTKFGSFGDLSKLIEVKRWDIRFENHSWCNGGSAQDGSSTVYTSHTWSRQLGQVGWAHIPGIKALIGSECELYSDPCQSWLYNYGGCLKFFASDCLQHSQDTRSLCITEPQLDLWHQSQHPDQLIGDSLWLQQTITHLVSNGIKFTLLNTWYLTSCHLSLINLYFE